jgi:hypothetical protein
MKRILAVLGISLVLGMAGCDTGGSGGKGHGSETDDTNTPQSKTYTGGNVTLILTEIVPSKESGVLAASNYSGAAFSVSDPQVDETFQYTLSVDGTAVSNGTVTIGAASWEFAPATAGQQPFSAAVSGDSLVFPDEVGGGISLPLKPDSGDNDNDDTKPDYGISLSETSTYTFPAATAGYGAQTQKSVTITNTGNQPTGDLTVTLSSSTAFTLDKTTIGSIAVNGSGTFTVTPKTGLGAGGYSATVTVSGGVNIAAKSFNVSWTVNASENTGYSIAEVIAYLDAQKGGKTADDPVLLQLDINLSSATDGWDALMEALADSDKYVALDLSSCSTDGTAFNIQSGSIFGKMKIVSLVLSSNATRITESSSYDNYYINLRTVSGANVTAIGYTAFYGCTSLTSVDFPEVTDIGSYAFRGCTSLTTVSFPKATSTGNNAFSGCTSLKSAAFPKATTIAGDGNFDAFGAFYNCTALTEVFFPEATTIMNSAFRGCTSLTSVSFPEVITIGSDAFGNCPSLTSVSFPNATSIGSYAFSGCTSMTEVSFPKVTDIDSWAFDGCTSLTTASFPKVGIIRDYAFRHCTALTSVSIPKAMIIEDYVFSGSGTVPLTITMGSAVPSIGEYIFSGVDGTKNVTVKVPSGAAGSYDATWQTAFKGGNDYINLLIQEY